MRAESPGRGRWDATPCGRVEDEGAAVALATADETDWASTCCAPETPPAQRSLPARYLRQTDVGVLHAGISSGWRCWAPAGPAPLHMPSQRGRHGRSGPGSPGRGALPTVQSRDGGGPCLVESRGRAAAAAPPGLARADVETPPSSVVVGPFILCANRRVNSVSWLVRVVVLWSVFCLVNGTRLR